MRTLLVSIGLLLPGLAPAADVRLSLGGSAEYDSNVFRTDGDEKSDIVFRLSPGIRVVEDREKLNYAVGYSLPYEIGVKYNNSDEVNDLNHLVDGTFQYRATPQTSFFGDDNFYYARGLFGQSRNLEDPPPGDIGDDRARILQNSTGLGVRHQFTPRLSGTMRVRGTYFDTTQNNRANNWSAGVNAGSDYQLTERHGLGAGLSYTRQSFENIPQRPGSETDYYNIFGRWQWLFNDTTTFNIQAGPALIHSNQEAPPATITNQERFPFQEVANGFEVVPGVPVGDDSIAVGNFNTCPFDGAGPGRLLFNEAGSTCAPIVIDSNTDQATVDAIRIDTTDLSFGTPPTSETDTRVTYFASASLTKRWTPTLASSLGYVREENTASGIDGGAVLDAITATTTWRLGERWDASFRADWTLRTSASEGARNFVIVTENTTFGPSIAEASQLKQASDNDSLDTQRWGVASRLAYRLTKNTVTALQYSYNRQSSEQGTVGDSSDFDDHLVTFTVQYNFEPIGLWW